MAVPMTPITDPDTARCYPCARCKQQVPLTGYRLLYHGTRRPLRCVACEIAAAANRKRASQLRCWQVQAATLQRYRRAHREGHRTHTQAYYAENQEDRRLYIATWQQLHPEQARAYDRTYYWRNRERINARRRAPCATPEHQAAVAARAADRKQQRRAAWRQAVYAIVAEYYGMEVGALLHPRTVDRDGPQATNEREARMIAVYLMLTRLTCRHPLAEIAADCGVTAQGVRQWRTRIRTQCRRRDAEGTDLNETITALHTAWRARGDQVRLAVA